MSWELDDNRPIYVQIVETMKLRIISGYYAAGGKLPSVRELATEAGVNPNTMQRALSELERTGLVSTIRTSGRVVTEDMTLLEQQKQELAQGEIEAFVEKMKRLGYDSQQTMQQLSSWIIQKSEEE